MLRRHGVIAVGLVLAAGLLGTAGCTGDDPKPKPSSAAEPTGRFDGTQAPDGGEVRVVESGFTAFVDGNPTVTFGVLLENTSKNRAAVEVKVTAKLYDAAGKEVRLGAMSQLASKSVTIMPGQRMGAGQDTGLSRSDVVGDPTELRVEIRTPSWYPASQVTGLALSDVKSELDPSGLVVFSFSVESRLPEKVTDPHLIVLARDHAGTLIGGYEPRPSPTAWPPGKSTQVAKTELPDAADRTRSEVFAGLSSIAE